MRIDIWGIDILGVDIFGIDILALFKTAVIGQALYSRDCSNMTHYLHVPALKSYTIDQ